MNEIKKILPKNLSSGFITATNKRSRNTLFLNSTNNLNNQSTLPTKPSPQKNKTIRLASDDVFKKINNNIKTKNRTSIKSSRIYLRLEQRDEIEKIISEEEKKRYVNKELNINKIINRDELKRRFKKVPFSDISIKKSRNKKYLSPKMKRPLSSISKKSSNEFSHTRGLISINNVLLQNFRSEGKNEIERSKKNFEMVNEFLRKVDEENMDKYYEIEKQFLKNKNNEEEKKNQEIINKKILKNNNKEKRRESIKIKESDFIKFKTLQMIKEKKFHRQKAKIFDNMLKNDYQNYYQTRSGENKYNTINYRLLSKTILMRNLMKQMKIATFKDETLNILQGFQSKKISDLANDKFNLENKDIYTNQSDNMYFFGNNKLKYKPIPRFLKVKFSMKTSKKFGEINGSCFGLPV